MPIKSRVGVAGVFLMSWLQALGAQAPTAPATAAAADPAPAQQSQLPDLALEDLLKLKVDTVYAASKFQQEVAQAPASVSIITSDEIRSHGYRTLADILRSVRGFYVSYDRNYSYVGVRGFERPGDYNGRVLLLVNGHQLNDTIFESALLGTESPLDVALFDRVEVIRGPSSSLYGTSAFFGVVNIITRSGRTVNGVEAEGQGGGLAARSGRVTAGGRSSTGLEGLVSVSAYDARGNDQLYFPEFDNPDTNRGVARKVDGDRSMNLFASASGHGLQMQMGYGARTKNVPTGSFGTLFNDPRTETRDARGFADVQFSRPLFAHSSVNLRASYDQYTYDGTYAYDTGLFLDGARGAWVTTEAGVVQRFSRHSVTLGFEYRTNLKQDQFANNETGVVLDDHRSSKTAALFVEDEVRINTHMLVNAGLRWDDYFDTFGGTVNPRLGLIVFPYEGSSVKLLYGQAFRAPNPYELYYEGDEISAQLKPERISTLEGVWEQRVTPRVQLVGSVYRNRVHDLISQQSGSTTSLDGLYFVNGGGVTATGVEVELQAILPGRVRVRVADAFQNANDVETGLRISNAPAQLATLVMDAPLGGSGLVAGFNTWFVGERLTVREVRVPGSVVSDITISAPRLGTRFAFAVSAHNVFGVAYGDPGSEEHRQQIIPQDGRTLTARATWRLR